MKTVLRKITERRTARKAEQRRRAIMVNMMRELREMAQDGLLVPTGMESLSVDQLVDGGWAQHVREGKR